MWIIESRSTAEVVVHRHVTCETIICTYNICTFGAWHMWVIQVCSTVQLVICRHLILAWHFAIRGSLFEICTSLLTELSCPRSESYMIWRWICWSQDSSSNRTHVALVNESRDVCVSHASHDPLLKSWIIIASYLRGILNESYQVWMSHGKHAWVTNHCQIRIASSHHICVVLVNESSHV